MLVIKPAPFLKRDVMQYLSTIANLTYRNYKADFPSLTQKPLVLAFEPESDIKFAVHYATADYVRLDVSNYIYGVIEAKAFADSLAHEIAHSIIERKTESRLLSNNLVHYAVNNYKEYRQEKAVYFDTLQRLTGRPFETVYTYNLQKVLYHAKEIVTYVTTQRPNARHPYWF